jgi:hypothetical protein
LFVSRQLRHWGLGTARIRKKGEQESKKGVKGKEERGRGRRETGEEEGRQEERGGGRREIEGRKKGVGGGEGRQGEDRHMPQNADSMRPFLQAC